VAVGADPDRLALLDNFCWPDPVEHAQKNPDGAFKMGQLVRCCRGLSRAVVAFQAPLISGKDSMKNDYHGVDGKLSIPPTLLISAIANLEEVGKAVTMDLKQVGDRVYLLGPEQSALAGSHYAQTLNFGGGSLGEVDFALALQLYRTVHQLMLQGVIASCHDCSEGGLAVALAEKAMAGRLGLEVQLGPSSLQLEERLFGEAPSRLVVSVAPQHQQAFEAALEGLPWLFLGQVSELQCLKVNGEELALEPMLAVWQGGLQL